MTAIAETVQCKLCGRDGIAVLPRACRVCGMAMEPGAYEPPAEVIHGFIVTRYHRDVKCPGLRHARDCDCRAEYVERLGAKVLFPTEAEARAEAARLGRGWYVYPEHERPEYYGPERIWRGRAA